MINLQDRKDCCGCHACSNVCPKQCIKMQTDEQGFLYPLVDTELCVDCGLCEKVCPVINQSEDKKPIKVFAAKNKNEEVRRKSSSGGVFTLLAEYVLDNGGVVFGAKFDDDWNVVHAWTDTKEGIADFRVSKYVQSTIGNTYREAKDFLTQGRKVLFSGTPCQIAGLKKYLRTNYENLITMDIICHGVPSPKVWQDYLTALRASFRTQCGVGKNSVSSSLNELPVITGISFRDKTNGWKKFGFEVCYKAASEAAKNTVSKSANDNDNTFLQPFPDNVFMKGFLANLYLRPSCYACAARSGKSGADISVGDYWGIHGYHPEFDDDKGIGLILINTPKGKELFEQFDAEYIETTYNSALRGNPCIEHSVALTKYSQMFWDNPTIQNIEIICKKRRPSFAKRCISKIRAIIVAILKRLK